MARIGASPNASDAAEEVNKLKLAVKYGADTVMDLSPVASTSMVRTAMLTFRCRSARCPTGSRGVHGSIEKLDEDDFLHIIEKHCRGG